MENNLGEKNNTLALNPDQLPTVPPMTLQTAAAADKTGVWQEQEVVLVKLSLLPKRTLRLQLRANDSCCHHHYNLPKELTTERYFGISLALTPEPEL